MSLPRFLRGLQKKPAIPVHPDPNLSDSSSSSSSSGPKDALGFPIPVYTVITSATTPTTTAGSDNNSSNPGPMDIVAPEYRLSAASMVSSAGFSAAADADSSFNTPTISVVPAGSQLATNDSNNNTNNKVRSRSSRSSSASSVNSSSFHHRPADSTATTATKDNAQLLSKPFPSSPSLFLSLSVSPPPPPSTTLPPIPIFTSKAAVTTPMVNLTSPGQTRPPQIIYPSNTSFSSVIDTTTAATTESATAKPTKTTMGFDIEVSYIEDQSDSGGGGGSSSGASSKRNSRSMVIASDMGGFGGIDQMQQFTAAGGSEAGAGGGGASGGKTGRIRSNAIALQKPHQQQLQSLPQEQQLIEGDLTAGPGAIAAAAVQHGTRWSNNSDLEQPPETLARDLVGAPAVVQEHAVRQSKHNSNNSYNISTTISSTRSRSSSTPLIAPTSLSATAGAPAAGASVSSSSFISSSSSSSSALATGSGSNSTTASRPVSVLKHTQPLPPHVQPRPKSILRMRSGSHPLLPAPSRPESMSLFEPPSPQHSPTKSTFPPTARLSITSDTSSLSRSSFLQQDPMEQPSPIIGAVNTATSATAVKNGSRRSSTQSSHRQLSTKDLEGTRSANSSLSSSPSEPSRPRNPSSTTQYMRADRDEYDNYNNFNNDNTSKRRQTPQDTLASGASVASRRSFPSVNDYNLLDTTASSSTASSTTTTTTAMATPLIATVPPENYTPLTLKSVRAAKSRNKLRQESQIGVATGIRRNSLPKSALTTTTSSGGNEGSIAGLSSTTPPAPVNHLPPLPTTPSPSNNNYADNPEMSALLNASPGRRRATSPSILSPLHSLPTDPSSSFSLSSSPSAAVASSSRRRESSTASTSGLVHMPTIMPRPILKDTSARDKMRESWMSEVPGITISGASTTSGSIRSVVGSGVPYSQGSALPSPSPVAPPKSLARTNSAGAKRQSKLNRHSASEHDQDALTPRPRQGSSGYGPDYRPRRQSGGPGHLLFTFDVSAASSADFESEEFEDSEVDDREELYSKHLQVQYTRLQQSQIRQSTMDGGSALSAAVMAAGSRLPNSSNGGEDNIPYLAKRGQRKSLGDELDVPPVPEKSMQRKRVSTMGATTLPAMSTSLVSALSAANNSSNSGASETLSSVNTTGQQKLKGPYGGGAIGGGGGSIGGNSLSFEPLFALKDSGSDSNSRRVGGSDSKLLLQGGGQNGNGGALGSRLSEVSDADWYTALLTIDPNQQGVSIMDLSKRGLTEVPSGLPSTITHLRLAYNLVQILTPITSLTALHHLQVLDLCDNQLEILPPELGLLTRLKELYLSNNKLYKLPDTIQRMARLEVLDVRNNQFYLLNPVVGRLKALRQLDVRHNQLKSLPPLLHMLSSTLTLLLVDGNQFVQPFSDLLQPLMSDDAESQASTSARQSYLGDDPYSDAGNSSGGRKMSTGGGGGMYEPWRRSVAPVQPRRGNNGGVAVLAKRRSHGDLMTLMGLQKRDGNASMDDLLNSAAALDFNSKSNTISTSSGAYIAASMGTDGAAAAATKRERSVSTSNLTPLTEIHSVITLPSASNSSSPHPLSLSKMFKSIRKSSKASLKDNHNSAAAVSARINDPKRYSIGSEVDFSVGDLESEASHPQEPTESKPNSRGSNHGVSRRATSVNKWVKGRFHKRTNSNDLGNLQANNASMTSLHSSHGGALDLLDGQQHVRDSGYGAIGGGSTPEPGASTRIIGNRHQNKSTGHLPSGSPFASRDSTHQLSSSFDPSQRRERDYRYSYMSMESQVTLGTENDSEAMDLDALSQQQHRLSSVHSPTTPLPSSPVMGLSSNQSAGPGNNWNVATPRYGQSAAHIKSLMQYLKDLHDLDPDSSEWEEVYAWRRVWNSERAAPAGLGGSNANTPASSQANKDSDEPTDEATLNQEQQEQLAKSEEVRLAKLQAQASKRRRIVEEIITTERTYVEGLKGLVEIYLTPALQIMPPGDHKAVFSNAQAIYTFHASHFLPELEKAFKISQSEAAAASASQQANKDTLAAQMMSPVSPVPTSSSQLLSDPSVPSSDASSSAALVPGSGSKQASDISAISSSQQQQDETTNRDSQALSESSSTAPSTPASAATTAIKIAVEDRIGRVFAEHVAYMKMYSFYINNFDNALRVLQTQLTQAKHKKKMKEFLRKCAKHPNHTQLSLQGYLLLPVQRIPRYKLLLQDLLQNTWVDHVDYQDIATALEKISTRADEMNERKRQYENHEKVLLVQNRIIGQYKTPLVQPHRKVVREGMLHLIRVVTRNVSMMGLDNKSSSFLLATSATAASPSVPVGDMTVHHLSEETVEKSFLFILFNDIMIQCNPVTGKPVSGGLGGSLAAMNGSSATLSSPAGASFSNGGGSVGGAGGASGGAGSAGGDGANAVAKNLELLRVLQLESRLHPAEVIGDDVLRVVDDAMVLYLTGDKDVIQAWKEDINSRW